MNILYGVQGTGNGHITRARVMLPALRALGCSVDFLFSGRAAHAYFDMQVFGNYQTRKGFTFSSQDGAIKWFKTFLQADIRQFYRDVKSIDLSRYDLIVTDFEPVTAWAGKQQKKPVLGLAHQYALCYPLPSLKRRLGLAQALQLFAPAKYHLGVHWDSFGKPIIPPLIELNASTPVRQDDFIVVYLPFENLTTVIATLQQDSEQIFIVYAQVECAQTYGNVHVRALSRTHFSQDFANCQGIISHAGFGLCSEAMVLGKKLLSIPIKGQMEQLSNAEVLKKLGRATIAPALSSTVLQEWLERPIPSRVYFPDVANEVAKWIVNGDISNAKPLVDKLWASLA